ncbi:phage holin family protein [Serratia marcescens]|uniref:phage holin family protein n=1 Tax=Serratia marcescens TaxID=615 RepID=UPI00101FFEF9|nr:phage holin family protein [Serratia marcescens]RZF18805.1 holin [Serratia marcescens]HDG0630491.1 phage holin family protein [Serratia marcescens]HEJ7052537.1 phage holin family protein [Serratia marcescens]
MKMNPDNDPNNIAGVSWLILFGMSCWGGLVRYLIDIKQNKTTWSWINGLAQIVVSGFAGILSGLVSISSGLDPYWTLFCAGISGAMGSVAITYFWERFSGAKSNGNQ